MGLTLIKIVTQLSVGGLNQYSRARTQTQRGVYIYIYAQRCFVESSSLFQWRVSELLALNVLAFLSGRGLSVKDWGWPRPTRQLLVTVL